MPELGFEPMITASKRAKGALDRSATVTGNKDNASALLTAQVPCRIQIGIY
jgi:hypothetical protein